MVDLAISPRSDVKPSSSNSTQKYNEYFVRAGTSSPIEDYDNEIFKWLYKDDEASSSNQTSNEERFKLSASQHTNMEKDIKS